MNALNHTMMKVLKNIYQGYFNLFSLVYIDKWGFNQDTLFAIYGFQ